MTPQISMEGVKKVLLLGIGGVGMSAVARVLKHKGYAVAGIDSCESKTTRSLREMGIEVSSKFSLPDLDRVDAIIYSSAIPRDSMEFQAAKERGIRIFHRADVLSYLLNQAETSIGVTGTHGKTTTSSMISYVLCGMAQNPTCLIGGEVLNFGSNTILGDSGIWVAEVDESDKSHEKYALNYVVITNLEQDHVENYHDLHELSVSFDRFLKNVQFPGLVVYSGEDELLAETVVRSGKPRVSVGFSTSFDYAALNIASTPFGSEFDLWEAGLPVVRVTLNVPGRHNIMNALCSIAVLTQMGYELDIVCQTLSGFKGAGRRLQLKGQVAGLSIIDDYAHHPTEVRASIAALRTMEKKVTVVFQPHRYTRTAYFFKEFAEALKTADEVILTDVYSAGEKNPGNVSTELILDEMVRLGHGHVNLVPREALLGYLGSLRDLSGILAFMGAGNIGGIADEFTSRLKSFAAA